MIFDNQGNNSPLLDRYIGLETEYAILRSQQSQDRIFDFAGFMESVSEKVPFANSLRNEFRYFLANGGCYSLENGGVPDHRHSFLEQATPECKSPLQLLESHQALQNLATSSIDRTYPDGTVVLAQGNHDGHGHTYGQHESFDVEVASGLNLIGWRMGLVAMMPCIFLYRVLAAIWILAIVGLAKTTRLTNWICQDLKRRWFNTPVKFLDEYSPQPISASWLIACAKGLRVLHAPIVFLLWCNIQLFALRSYRRKMTAFLVSRCILDGAGFVDSDGRYGISSRGWYVNSMIGFGGYGRGRPIFRCDSWLRTICLGSPLQFRGIRKLLRKRQRIEIAIGDSGLCHHAQLVRIGATSLVIDLIARKPHEPYPVLRDPILSIRRFCKDWMIMAKETDRSGRLWRALDIQEFYLEQVRSMVDADREAPSEASFICHHWQSLLRQLEQSEETNEPNRELVGRLDWVTKLWLLDQLDKDVEIDARRKLDLRYHELSDAGYGRKVLSVVQHAGILKSELIERAIRNPPAEFAPQQRSYYIREFGGTHQQLKVDWEMIEFQSATGMKSTVRIRP